MRRPSNRPLNMERLQVVGSASPRAAVMDEPSLHVRKRETNGPGFGASFRFFCLSLIVVAATALPARDHAAVASIDRSGHHAAVAPRANGHTAWADADGGV